MIPSLRIVAAAAILAVSPAQAETLTELSQHTHYHGIAFLRAGTAELLLATHHGLFALDKNGTATRVSPVQDFMGFSPDPSSPVSYYASGHPATGGNSGFLHSGDGGMTWTQLSEGIDGPVDFHQMTVSPVDPKTIYGNYRQMQVSRDGGKTWTIAGTTPAQLIAIAASAAESERLYGATKSGLKVSHDSGATWNALAFDGELVSAVQTGPNTVYAFVIGRGLMKSDDAAEKWTELSNNFGEAVPLHIAIDPENASHLAVATHDNNVLESDDGGSTWRPFGSN